ncbi:MAG: AGE family epimerase/isomerase [Anaerolineae bacterium]|nr:AGE family epimerase/isomerase [Anaerolineae bacterium]
MTTRKTSGRELAARLEAELTGNILPVWMRYAPDRENGGFYGALTNAFQLAGGAHFEAAARACWDYIQAKHVDRVHGGWFKLLDRAGEVISPYKVDPWACPYHHSRACLEMMARLRTEG